MRFVALLVAAALTSPGCARRDWGLDAAAHGPQPLATQQLADGPLRDFTALRPICTLLSPRLGVACIRSAADWQRLSTALPAIGPAPDLRRGMVIAVISLAGTPIDGPTPLDGVAARGSGERGELSFTFNGGSFQPDGSAYAAVAFVEGLRRLEAIQINGVRFTLR
ncbi:hypothetical protein RAS1_06890 [Phycisphaerae bacterium RAS1]|nr:hypothetical protein RAS1_06890 [Phycisphaerae bacterium RAS1]